MQGDADVIEALNEVLTAELTAINQWFIHSKMCEDWGYQRLAKHHYDESIEEMKHAESIIARILYLEGVPNMQRLFPVRVGETVPEQMQVDLEMEREHVERLNKAVALCVDKGDNGTRELLADILTHEEHGVDWIESQVHMIEELGKENYLAQQMHG